MSRTDESLMLALKVSLRTSMVSESATGTGRPETQTVGKAPQRLSFTKLSFAASVDATRTLLTSATPKHLANFYQQSHGRNAPRGKRFEANFNLHPDGSDGAGCSQDVPPGPSNAITLLPSEDPTGTEDMMVEYASTDVFGDFD